MTELVATIVIMLCSAVLFGYWFRYTCLLILSAKTADDYALQVAKDNRLSFLGVQAELCQATGRDLDRLRDLLDRDYSVIRSLLKKVGSAEVGVEGRMLAIDFRLNRVWYLLTRQRSACSAREALNEMASLVAYFANSIGEAAVNPSAV